MLTFSHPEAVNKFLTDNSISQRLPSLELLETIGRNFQKIPYENITKIIRSHTINDIDSRIRLPELLYEDYKRYGTGGTCFSMTYFLQTILRSCGFKTYPVIADRPLAKNTHCLSIVELNAEKYILDPGFMIDSPLLLTKIPKANILRHNQIIIGAKGSIDIPLNQLKYFEDLALKSKEILPYQETDLDTNSYMIATKMHGRTDIRYYFEDTPLETDKLLKYWLDSFDWPGLRSISITQATDNGYLYARNNFLRKNTYEGKRQERIKEDIALTLRKTFNIDEQIIESAFDIIETLPPLNPPL